MNFYAKYPFIGSGGGGSGTVTSVGLSAPSIFTVTGSPVTTAGVLTLTLNTQPANTVFAGPTSGADAPPTFRLLVPADIPTPTGPAFTFAGYDGSGNLSVVPTWNFVADGGSSSYVTRVYGPDVSPTTDKVQSQEIEITNTQNNSDISVYGISFDIHQDRTRNNFDFTGSVSALSLNDSIEGTGSYGQHQAINLHQTLGQNGGGSAQDTAVFQTSTNIGAGFAVQDHDYFYGNFQNDGVLSGNLRLIHFDINGSVAPGGFIEGFGINSNINSTGGFTGLNINQGGNTGGNFNGISVNNSGSLSSFSNLIVANNNGPALAGINLVSPFNSAAVTGNFSALNSGNTGDISSNAGGLSFFNSSNVGGDLNMLTLGNNSGAFTVGGTISGANIYNNVNSAQVQMMGLYDNSTTTNYKNGLNINLQGAANDTQGINISIQGNYANSVQGLNISLGSSVSPHQKTGLSIDDGACNVQSNYDTGVLGGAPGGEFQLNDFGGTFHIAAGHPITDGSFGFGNNIGIQVFAEDDMPVDSTGVDLGFSVNGFVDQIGVVAGKTLHTINYMAAGGGIFAGSTGGTIVNANLFRALGFLPEGGTLSITNLYGFKVDPLLDVIGATNEWGVWVGASNADNWFKKNVVIGGSTGKPTGAFVLDITGQAKIVDGTQAAGRVLTSDASGAASWQDLPAGSGYTTNTFTLSGTDITNGFVTLTGTPANPTGTVLNIVGGVVQQYGPDFIVTGNQLSWTGLFLDGVLTAGDVLIAQFY